MDCERAVLDVQSSIDEELDPGSELELKRHLEQCPSCRSWADQVLAIREAVRRLPASVPSNALDRRVMKSFLASRTSSGSAKVLISAGMWLSKPALAFIAVAVIIFGVTAFYLGWTLGQRRYENTVPSPAIEERTRTERPRVSQSRTDPTGRATESPVSLADFRPILEPKIRILGRQAQ